MATPARQIKAEVAIGRGDTAEAIAESERALAFARNVKDPQVVYPTLALHAWLLALAGRRTGSERALRRAHGSGRRARVTTRTAGRSSLAFALDDLGRPARLHATADRARESDEMAQGCARVRRR